MAPEGHSAEQMPQPRQMFALTLARTGVWEESITAPCGQVARQTPQPMQQSSSTEDTCEDVSTYPAESIETALDAAALA
jgi:hypothetical protein